jgi:histone-binding protein RBBP4
MAPGRAVGLMDGSSRARIWKESHVPLLYDWISSRKLLWPHAAVQWGHRIPAEYQRHRGGDGGADAANYTTRAVYLAERTGDAGDPNTLLYFDARITQEHTSKVDDVAKPWVEESVVNARSDGMSTPEFWLRKRIIHPGEVNKIRTILPNIVVTHTDSPKLYVWDFANQPSRKKDEPKHKHNIPTCTLVGHTRNAEYALSVAAPSGVENPSGDMWIASGGTDCCILVWRLEDYEAAGKDIDPYVAFNAENPGGSGSGGHRLTVEDVSFCVADRNVIASVSRDSTLLVWDVRESSRPISVVMKAHDGDINTCDFGGPSQRLIATGGSDTFVRVWDQRKLVNAAGVGVPLGQYSEHTGQINTVQWNKFAPNVFASSSDDGEVLVWDMSLAKAPGAADLANSHSLLFRHVGHNLQRERATVVDFEWLPDESDPWCICTISEMIGDCGGSTLQVWRLLSMIYEDKTVVAADLRELQQRRQPVSQMLSKS